MEHEYNNSSNFHTWAKKWPKSHLELKEFQIFCKPVGQAISKKTSMKHGSQSKDKLKT
jgi:hypothetical protein